MNRNAMFVAKREGELHRFSKGRELQEGGYYSRNSDCSSSLRGWNRIAPFAFQCALGLITALFFTGCRTAVSHFPTVPKSSAHETNAVAAEGTWHSVSITPAPDTPDISTWQKFNPIWWIGNADDPVPPDWYRPGQKLRRFKWHLRNPFHNFTFYVIGIADKPHVRSGCYPRKVRNPEGGWNVSVARYGILRLPFVAYWRGKFNFYLGWRTEGNFGARMNFKPTRSMRQQQDAAQSIEPSDNNASPAAGP